MGGKEKWEMGEGVQEEEKWRWYLPTLTACDRVSYYILDGFLWVVSYMIMCTCIILIVNVPPEQVKMDQCMLGKEDKQVKQHYVTSSQKLN